MPVRQAPPESWDLFLRLFGEHNQIMVSVMEADEPEEALRSFLKGFYEGLAKFIIEKKARGTSKISPQEAILMFGEAMVEEYLPVFLKEATKVDPVLALIKKARSKFSKNSFFGGNCGQFAWALAKALNEQGIEATLGLICSQVEEEADLLHDVDVYHMFVEANGAFYDGSGKIDKEYLGRFAEEWYGDPSPQLWTEFGLDTQTQKIISANTAWKLEWGHFYKEMAAQKEAAPE